MEKISRGFRGRETLAYAAALRKSVNCRAIDGYAIKKKRDKHAYSFLFRQDIFVQVWKSS